MTQLKSEPSIIPEADQQDIDELKRRIVDFKTGKEDEERFKLYRLTRGVYGQRQLGVHMFRLKIPFGRITSDQLIGVANISDQYATGNLHLTTRQNIQLHYVKLDDSPEVWTQLSTLGLTAREACGNTVRNITASPKAGIDPEEAFDVSPYVQAVFEYFLRNPICQEMGRKIKPAFSASEKDSAYTYFSDFGFIPLIKNGVRGFNLVIGGGLGALAISAKKVTDFIPSDKIIPFMEGALRIFDRYGEREKRQKARLKFLIKEIGVDTFLSLVDEEIKSLKHPSIPINVAEETIPALPFAPSFPPSQDSNYVRWTKTNTFSQKQNGYRGVYIKITLGDLSSNQARALAPIVKRYAADDIRITIGQNLLLRYVPEESLFGLYSELKNIGLAASGANTITDITACPGTDTCNLGVTNSTGLALELEKSISHEYRELLDEHKIDIKISGCMNACGQHMASAIGFHGSSIKVEGKIVPAMQVVIGGGLDDKGVGHIGNKVIKLPTKRIPQAVKIVLEDYLKFKEDRQSFLAYSILQGKRYYYDLLKTLAEKATFTELEFMDWGQEHEYRQAIGVGECAGVILDVIGTILKDAKEKLSLSKLSATAGSYRDAVYHAYSAYVITAKALLLGEDIKCNTHIKILEDFQSHFVDTGKIPRPGNFVEEVLRMKDEVAEETFVKQYILDAHSFYEGAIQYRNVFINDHKTVVDSYYKA